MRQPRDIPVAELVETWQAPLYNYARRWLRDAVEAEDATQEIFIEVLRCRHTVQSPLAFKAWIYRIAGRVLQRHSRRRREKAGTEAIAAVAAASASSLEADEQRAILERSVAALPERIREALSLRYYEGLNQYEVAEALELPRSTVQSRIKKGLELLRESLTLSGAAALAPELEALLALPQSFKVPASLSSSLTKLSAGAETAALIGGGVMSTKTKIAALSLALALLGGVAWTGLGSTRAGAEGIARAASERTAEGATAPGEDQQGESAGEVPVDGLTESSGEDPVKPAEEVQDRAGAAGASGAKEKVGGASGQGAKAAAKKGSSDLRVRLLKPDADPYQGPATVSILVVGESTGWLGRHRLKTDDDGRLQGLPTLEPGSYKLRVDVAPYKVLNVRAVIKAGEDRPLIVARFKPSKGIWVTVFSADSRQAIEGVRLSMRRNKNGKSRVYKTDAEGRAYVRGVRTGPHYIHCRREGYSGFTIVGDHQQDGELDKTWQISKEDISSGLHIYMGSGYRVSGRVLDPEGLPIEAEVSLQATKFALPKKMRSEGGRFDFSGVGSGRYVLWVKHPDHPVIKKLVDLSSQSPIKTFELRFAASFKLSGRVTDEAGSPIAGARVAGMAATSSGPFFSTDRGHEHSGGQREVRSDAEGRFTIGGLMAGSVDLIVSAPGYAAAMRRNLAFGSSFQESVEFRLVRGGTIKGRVLRPDGRPAERCSVFYRREGSWFARSGWTDKDGRFRIDGLASTRHDLRFWPREGARTIIENVSPGPGEQEFRLAEAVEVLGRVETPPGGAAVREIRCANTTARVGPNGRFKMRMTLSPSEELAFVAGDYQVFYTRVSLSGSEKRCEVSVRFEHGASLEGQVVSRHGRACSDAILVVRTEDGRKSVSRTTEAGGFILKRLPAGKLSLLVGYKKSDGGRGELTKELQMVLGEERVGLVITVP